MPIPLLMAAAGAGGWFYKIIRFTDDEQTPEAERAARMAAFAARPLARDPIGRGNWLYLRRSLTFEAHAGFSNTACVVRWELLIDSSTHFIKIVHGHVSGKRRVYVDDRRVHESRDVMDMGLDVPLPDECKEALGGNQATLHIIENFDEQGDWLYDLSLNGERLTVLSERRAAQAHSLELATRG